MLGSRGRSLQPRRRESSRGALLPDYYVRTGAEQLEEVPPIKAELERIWSDYEFVCSGPSWEAVAERTANYKELDILS